MSLGRMTDFIKLTQCISSVDEEGFSRRETVVVAECRAYHEGRHGSETWANRAAFSGATDLFRFRVIPGVTVTTAMLLEYEGNAYDIISVLNAYGRGMYLEVLTKRKEPSGGGTNG